LHPYADPDPESGSFCHKATLLRKNLIPAVLGLLYDYLSLKNDVNVASKSNKQKSVTNPQHWQKLCLIRAAAYPPIAQQ
jgi:hypothetical protein